MKVCVVSASLVSARDIFPHFRKKRVVDGVLSCFYDEYEVVFLPRINSLFDFSSDDVMTRNCIYSFDYDFLLFVFDEYYFKRDLNLLLQLLLVTNRVYVWVKDSFSKSSYVRYDLLSEILNVPILRDGKIRVFPFFSFSDYRFSFGFIEEELSFLDFITENRGVSIKSLCLGYSDDKILNYRIKIVFDCFYKKGIRREDISTIIFEIISSKCMSILDKVYFYNNSSYSFFDKIFMGKISGKIVMVFLLFLIFFITINLANYPSSLLYNFFSSFNDDLFNFFCFFGEGVSSCLVYGVYRILTWTVSVMLPPMAIFFPLFALLEKSGYLPRVAFNLDNVFQKCGSCGRQALTMMMGFGCNAVGVTESRYIDSEREKLISILTNSLVPCNGRFPILTSVITMFMFSGAIGSLILTMFIVLSVLFTFFLSKFLSSTILKGNSSSFSLELPPYRT